MRGALVIAAGVALVTAAAGAGGGPAAPQQPSFSARVDTVRVDVDVRRNNAPISGLSAADFEVLDNGVKQTVDLVSSTAAPISVVLALDTSASLDAKERAHLAAASVRVVDALKAPESSAFLTFSERIAIRSLFTTNTETLKRLIAAPTVSGDTALYDAAHAAMLVGTTAPGRPIVILFSDGDDSASFLGAGDVLATAQRTGAVVCIVMIGGEGTLLRELASLTGGVFVKETSHERVGARFTELLESFRRRYLVSFTPTGVEKPGWHKLVVRVKGGGDVRARAGYWSGPAATDR